MQKKVGVEEGWGGKEEREWKAAAGLFGEEVVDPPPPDPRGRVAAD